MCNMPLHRPWIRALVLLLVLGGVIRAEDEAPPDAPGRVTTSSFPVPSAAHAFTFRGEVRLDDRAAGQLFLQAKPVSEPSGAVLWAVTERWQMLGGRIDSGALAAVDRSLAPIRGVAEDHRPEAPSLVLTWKRTEAGIELAPPRKEGEDAVEPRRVPVPAGTVTTTLAALAVLSRHVLPGGGTLPLSLLQPVARGGDLFVPLPWEVRKDGEWDGQPAWVGSGTAEGADTYALYFEPETERLLGLRLTTKRGFVVEVHATSVPEAEVDPFIPPARTAEAAALQGALALAAADLPLLEAVVYWPVAHGLAATAYQREDPRHAEVEPFPTLARFRARQMQHFAETLRKRPRHLVEGTLRELRGEVKTEPLGSGYVRFLFPEKVGRMDLTVGEVDGIWYLMGLPVAGR